MNEFVENFLVDSQDTGRHIVTSFRTGRKYYVEPIGSGRMSDWGSVNPASGEMENKKGAGKYAGSVTEKESVVKEENGFSKVHTLPNGSSPYSFIDELDKQYPTPQKNN